MADWDRFEVTKSKKVIINGKEKLDIIGFRDGRKYFLNKEIIANKEILTTLKNYTQEDLKRKDFKYPIYSRVTYAKDEKTGITTRITDPKTLNEIIQKIEEELLNL